MHSDDRTEGWTTPVGARCARVRTGEDAAGAVLAISGDIDAPDGDAIRPLLVDLLRATAHPVVTLDLSAVTYFGSRALALIVLAERIAATRGIRLRGVTGPGNARVVRPLRLTGVGGSVAWSATSPDAGAA